MITLAAIVFWFALVGGVLLLVWPLCKIGEAVLDADTFEDLRPGRVSRIGHMTVTFYEDDPEGHHGR